MLRLALESAFPEIPFKGTPPSGSCNESIDLHFADAKKPKRHWIALDNRRRFFIDLAKDFEFDPTDPEAWDKLKRSHVIEKVCS